MKTLQLSLCSFLFLLLLSKICSQNFTRVIKTLSGPVQGTTVNFNGYIIDQYLGLPFAQPPLGKLRFRKPLPVKPWTTVFVADKMGPACIQHCKYEYPWCDSSLISEDCLNLNIWVPRSKRCDIENAKIPVMLWIYGGGNTVGSNKLPLFNGVALAALGDIVVVTINYRLSSLGFFTTGTETAPGNVAMYDILEALKWVNKNIDAFGGDSNQITISGQSSGAITVGLLCVSPLTKGLFRRIILESGSPALFKVDNITTNLDKSQKIAEEVGCANQVTTVYHYPNEVADCMREKNALNITLPMDSFSSAIRQTIFPHYGDKILPINARVALMKGRFHKVDVLIGNTHDEGSQKLAGTNASYFGLHGEKNPKISKKHGISIMKDVFKDISFKDDIIQYYLGKLSNYNYDRVREQVYTAIGDFRLLCPTKYFAEIYSQFGNDVYYYFFVHRTMLSPWAKWLKVIHFEEVQYVFGNPLLHPRKYSRKEVTLSLRVIRIFSNFVKYGTPECSDQPSYPESNWPMYSRENPVYVTLGAAVKRGRKGYGQGPHSKNCEFYRPYFGFT